MKITINQKRENSTQKSFSQENRDPCQYSDEKGMTVLLIWLKKLIILSVIWLRKVMTLSITWQKNDPVKNIPEKSHDLY